MQKIRTDHRHTLAASFLALFVQAVVNNFAPLLFLTFQNTYAISREGITSLIVINFVIQLLTSFAFSYFADRLGYRASMVLGNLCAAMGLMGMGFLPGLFSDPFRGLRASVAVYALGAGIIEVLASPIVERCPTRKKAATMSLLHSFYSWGQMSVVLLSTAFFALAGIGRWKLLAVLWALFPLLDALYFLFVPIDAPKPADRKQTAGRLFKTPVFLLLFLLMICAGASEQAVAQWSSAFAEGSLGVSKTLGDLAGPMFFALMMGIGRTLHAAAGYRIVLRRTLSLSGALCAAGLFMIYLAGSPLPAFLGMGLAGFAVAVLWPGMLSMAAGALPEGGTAMYALLAVAGQTGCVLGPAVVGFVSARLGGRLKPGFLAAAAFPLAFLLLLYILARLRKRPPQPGKAGI